MDARRISKEEINGLHVTHDVLYENKCNYKQAWLVNDEYLKVLNGLDDTTMENVQIAKQLMDTDFPGLTKRQKQVMKYFIIGYTQNEIAEILNINQSVVSRIFNAGVKKIKKNFYQLKEK